MQDTNGVTCILNYSLIFMQCVSQWHNLEESRNNSLFMCPFSSMSFQLNISCDNWDIFVTSSLYTFCHLVTLYLTLIQCDALFTPLSFSFFPWLVYCILLNGLLLYLLYIFPCSMAYMCDCIFCALFYM